MTLFLPSTISTIEYGSVAPLRNNVDAWTPFSSGAYLSDRTSTPLQLTFTPPAACYFSVDLRMLIESSSVLGATSYVETFVSISPTDLDGTTACVALVPLGTPTPQFSSMISGIFRLRAGVAYTWRVALAGSFVANQARYYGGPTYCELTGAVVGY